MAEEKVTGGSGCLGQSVLTPDDVAGILLVFQKSMFTN